MSRSMTLIVAALSFTAFAQERMEKKPTEKKEMTMTEPKPSKELETFMKPLEGNWTCDTKMLPGAMGPNSPETTAKTTLKISKDTSTNGMWYRGEYSSPKTKSMPAMTGYFMMANDDAAKMLTSISWDNHGGASMGTGTISGETATWTGEAVMMGQKMKMRDTVTKSGTKMIHKFEGDSGKGFQPMGEDSCTKENPKS